MNLTNITLETRMLLIDFHCIKSPEALSKIPLPFKVNPIFSLAAVLKIAKPPPSPKNRSPNQPITLEIVGLKLPILSARIKIKIDAAVSKRQLNSPVKFLNLLGLISMMSVSIFDIIYC
jgi:hypothetical protein